MKTRFSSREIAHVWANLPFGSEAHGKSPGNASFSGNAFNSYATTIARKVEGKGGAVAVLVDCASFSVSTSKTQSRLRCAIPPSLPVFHVQCGLHCQSLGLSGAEVADNIRQQADSLIEQASKARGRAERLLADASAKVGEYNRAISFFGLSRKQWAPDLAQLTIAAKEKAKASKLAAQRKADVEKARSAKFSPLFVELWRNHGETTQQWAELKEKAGRVYSASPYPAPFNCILRLSADGSRVETSKGAQVLVRSVKFLYALAKGCKDSGKGMDSVDCAMLPPLDHYRVNTITAEGHVTAGCHEINFAEVEYIARQLGIV